MRLALIQKISGADTSRRHGLLHLWTSVHHDTKAIQQEPRASFGRESDLNVRVKEILPQIPCFLKNCWHTDGCLPTVTGRQIFTECYHAAMMMAIMQVERDFATFQSALFMKGSESDNNCTKFSLFTWYGGVDLKMFSTVLSYTWVVDFWLNGKRSLRLRVMVLGYRSPVRLHCMYVHSTDNSN